MATYKVSYFPGKGNAEIIRLALIASGQTFEDERLTREEWIKVKSNSPTKQMPLLTVNGTVYGQSGACARYIARKFGLFGRTPEEELLIDEVYECIVDFQKEIAKVIYEKDDTKKAELKETVMTQHLPRLNEYITLRTKQFGENGYIIGPTMTLADLQLYNTVDQVGDRVDLGVFSAFPDLQKHADLVRSDHKVAEWIKKMPAPQN
ncbi:probable glutathione S-transferase 8 [Mercenaria mercenaria]|uniref:probable glutathione S-transferase 8 n=1 Tax=Mercenaria mercenaria TaxID=6596 RepID=UPI001E1DADB6|nr:probable glutathione S-transferase 8 [Mercenaria mercenaria]